MDDFSDLGFANITPEDDEETAFQLALKRKEKIFKAFRDSKITRDEVREILVEGRNLNEYIREDD